MCIASFCPNLLRLSDGCSHVAAILFKVECAVRLGYTSVTSQACQWNDVYCKKVHGTSHLLYPVYKISCPFFQVEPAPIAQINFSRPQRGKENNSTNIPNDNTS